MGERLYARLLVHYLTLALEKADVKIDGDVRAELGDICADLEDTMRTIARQEIAQAIVDGSIGAELVRMYVAEFRNADDDDPVLAELRHVHGQVDRDNPACLPQWR